jgi:hypothetical protein
VHRRRLQRTGRYGGQGCGNRLLRRTTGAGRSKCQNDKGEKASQDPATG